MSITLLPEQAGGQLGRFREEGPRHVTSGQCVGAKPCKGCETRAKVGIQFSEKKDKKRKTM